MQDKVKLFVNPLWRMGHLPHAPLMYPFWGIPSFESTPFMKDIFNWRNFNTSYYEITDNPLSADVVFSPYRYNILREGHLNLLKKIHHEAMKLKKPLLIDGTGDIEYKIDLPHTYITRIGLFKWNKKENEIAVPVLSADLLEVYCNGELTIKQKEQLPSISFTGWAGQKPFSYTKTFLKDIPIRLASLFDEKYSTMSKGVLWRKKAISILRGAEGIKMNILDRKTFSAHVKTASKDMKVLRKEFVDNLLRHEYGLAVRGDANSSVRFYETLSLGRIPVLIDTECVLPFEDEVDYKSFCVFVDWRELELLPEKLKEFHRRISPKALVEMEHKARAAYLEYFRLDGFTTHLMKRVKRIAQQYV